MGHIAAGISHASKWIPGCGEQTGIEHCTSNRERFSQLALFYGWTYADDRQFIYEHQEPRRVHSVDHGHFFPGSTAWTEETLRAAPTAAPDTEITQRCGPTDDDLAKARESMIRVADADIADAVVAPPDEWGMSSIEREAVAEFLVARRDVIFGVPEEEENG